MSDMDAKKMEKVQGLVDRFSKVRAKQAAAILEKTDDDVSLLVLDTMPAAKSGKILAAMAPEAGAEWALASNQNGIFGIPESLSRCLIPTWLL